jgi:hypothetical protein
MPERRYQTVTLPAAFSTKSDIAWICRPSPLPRSLSTSFDVPIRLAPQAVSLNHIFLPSFPLEYFDEPHD